MTAKSTVERGYKARQNNRVTLSSVRDAAGQSWERYELCRLVGLRADMRSKQKASGATVQKCQCDTELPPISTTQSTTNQTSHHHIFSYSSRLGCPVARRRLPISSSCWLHERRLSLSTLIVFSICLPACYRRRSAAPFFCPASSKSLRLHTYTAKPTPLRRRHVNRDLSRHPPRRGLPLPTCQPLRSSHRRQTNLRLHPITSHHLTHNRRHIRLLRRPNHRHLHHSHTTHYHHPTTTIQRME